MTDPHDTRPSDDTPPPPSEASGRDPVRPPGSTRLPRRLEEGGEIGGYRLLRLLGRGGQGLVYLAEDLQLSRRVALKIIASQWTSSKSAIARFRREAEIASRLDHQGICGVYEFGEDEGFQYIAMRYVQGSTLAERIERLRSGDTSGDTSDEVTVVTSPPGTTNRPAAAGHQSGVDSSKASSHIPTSRDEILRGVRVIEHAARALHVAHQAGLIHRDVKPGNIMVTEADDEPVLLDFGLAREEEDSDQGLTVSGDLLGTPAYMSPEQLAAHRIALDRRTDVYSLGVTLYELLTLERPFDAPTRDTLYQKILTAPLPNPRRINPQIPRDLKVVLETAVEKDRERRYESALAFAEDLKRVRHLEPIQARPAGPILRFQRWTQRNPVLATATVVLFLTLSVGLIVSLSLLSTVHEEKGKTEHALEMAKTERDQKQAALEAKESALKDREQALNLAQSESRAKQAALNDRETALAKLQEALSAAQAERDAKDKALQRAEGLFLTGQASAQIATNPGRAYLLAVEGAKRHPSGLANNVIAEAFQADRELRVFDEHGSSVVEVRFSPSGKTAVTVDGTARLWDLDSGEVVHRFFDPDHRGINLAEFSPNGKYLATAAFSTPRVLLWDLKARKLLTTMTGHQCVQIESIMFSPDGSRIVSAAKDGAARVYAVPDGRSISTFRRGRTGTDSAVFFPDSVHVVCSSTGMIHYFRERNGVLVSNYNTAFNDLTSARVFDSNSGRPVADLRGQVGRISVVAPSSDGTRVLTLTRLGIQVFDSQSRERVFGVGATQRAEARHTQAAFSPDGHVLDLRLDGRLRLWDISDQSELWRVTGIYAAPNGPAPRFTPDGRRLVLLHDDNSVDVRDAETGELERTLRGHENRVVALCVSPDSRRLLTGSIDGSARLWDISKKLPFGRVPLPEGIKKNALTLLSPDRQLLLAANPGRDPVVVDRRAEREVATLSVPQSRGFRLFKEESMVVASYTGDGGHIVAASAEGLVYFWDAAGKAVTASPGVTFSLLQMDFSRDGKRLVGVTPSGDLKIIGLPGFKTVADIPAASDKVSRPRFTASGDAVYGFTDRTVRFWDAKTGEPTRTLELSNQVPGAVTHVLLSPNERRLAVTGQDMRVSLHDAVSGLKIGEWTYGETPAVAMEFSSDSERLFTLSSDRLLVIPASAGPSAGPSSKSPSPVRIGGASRRFNGATFSPSGESVATLSGTGQVELWDVARATSRRAGTRTTSCLAFNSTGSQLVTGDLNGELTLWDVKSGQLLRRFERSAGQVDVVSFSPDDQRIVTVARGAVVVRSVSDGGVILQLKKGLFNPQTIQSRWGSGEYKFSPDSKRVAGLDGRRQTLRAWDVGTGKVLFHRETNRGRFSAFAFDRSGERLFLKTFSGFVDRALDIKEAFLRPGARAIVNPVRAQNLEIIDVATGKAIGVLDSTLVRSWQKLVVSPNGKFLAALSGGWILVWDVASAQEVHRANQPTSRHALIFSPDGRYLALGNYRGLYLWDSATGETSTIGTSFPVDGDIAFTPDGRQILAASSDGNGYVWNREDGKLLATLKGHVGAVTKVAASPDGRWAATASVDRSVRAWNLQSGENWCRYLPGEAVREMAFTADGRIVATTESATLHDWPVDLTSVADHLHERRLTPADHDAFKIGAAVERQRLRATTAVRRSCREARLAAASLARGMDNQGARQSLRYHLSVLEDVAAHPEDYPKELMQVFEETLQQVHESVPTSESVIDIRARVLAGRGDLRSAIVLLEEEMAQAAGETPALRQQLLALRRRFRPDIASLASIDASLEEPVGRLDVGAEWFYMKGTREPSAGMEWTALEFQPEADKWLKGRAGIGYGDGDDATELTDMAGAYSTVYVRHVFELPPVAAYEHYFLRVTVDDACVAYLNGQELGRHRAGEPGQRLAHTALAGGFSTDPGETIDFPIPTEGLRAGKNVLALQGLNNGIKSSDLSLHPRLLVRTEPDVARDRGRFAEFLAVVGDPSDLRVGYLEARLLERVGKYAEAAARFAALHAKHADDDLLVLGRVRCLREMKRQSEALKLITDSITSRQRVSRRLWSEWVQLSIAEGSSIVDLSQFLQDYVRQKRPRAESYASDLAWAFQQLLETRSLRLNCGGGKYRGKDGVEWGADRFFGGSGRQSSRRNVAIANTDDDRLFQEQRLFWRNEPGPHGYRIPLPPGRYRVRLGAAEILGRSQLRQFSVRVESAMVIGEYRPKGVRKADYVEFECEVSDGILDLEFVHENDQPTVATLEVLPPR